MNHKSKRPTVGDRKLWQEYWKNLGQEWRTEPEITVERQTYLTSLTNVQDGGNQPGFHFRTLNCVEAISSGWHSLQ